MDKRDKRDKGDKGNGSKLATAGAIGADLATSTLGCIAGACPGKNVTDWVLRHNTAPFRVVAKSAMVLSLGIEVHDFNQARLKSDRLGMLDATLDAGALLSSVFLGVPGVVFSASYTIVII